MEKKKTPKTMAALVKGIGLLWKASPGYLVAILLFSGLSGAIVPLNTFVWKFFLDDIAQIFTTYTWSQTAVYYLAALSLLTGASYVLNAILQYVKQTFSDTLDLHVTDTVLKKSLLFPMEVYDQPETYNQLNMAITQTSQRCLSLLDTISEIVYAIIQMGGMVLIIAQYSWLVILVGFLSAIPLAWVSMKSNTYWYQVFVKRTEKFRLINYLKMIMVKNENIKEIKLFRVGRKIVTLIRENYAAFLKSDKKARKEFAAKRTAAQILDEVVSCGVKIWILISSLSARSTIGTVVMFFNTQTNLKGATITLLNQFSNLHNSSLYLQAIQKVQAIPASQKQGETVFKPNFSKIEFKEVSFRYPNSEVYALQNISLVFEMGKTYSIVGFNGSGKTTLIKLLLKLYAPTSGAIYVDGVDLQTIDTDSYYEHLSAIFQDFIKYPFSVAENIAPGAQSISEDDLPYIQQAGALADVDEFIQSLPHGYDTLLMKDWSNGVDVSQGQWQKIAIARCFCRDSVIAVLDEPFSSLDADAENRIVNQFRHTRKGRLNIFITHRFSSITLADEIFVIERGTIIEQGSHAELLQADGTYARLYNAQMISLEQL